MDINGKWTVAWPNTDKEDWQIRNDVFGTFDTKAEAVNYARKVFNSYINNYGKTGNYEHKVWDLFCGWDWTQEDMSSLANFKVGQIKVLNTLSDIVPGFSQQIMDSIQDYIGDLPICPGCNPDISCLEDDLDDARETMNKVFRKKRSSLNGFYKVENIQSVLL